MIYCKSNEIEEAASAPDAGGREDRATLDELDEGDEDDDDDEDVQGSEELLKQLDEIRNNLAENNGRLDDDILNKLLSVLPPSSHSKIRLGSGVSRASRDSPDTPIRDKFPCNPFGSLANIQSENSTVSKLQPGHLIPLLCIGSPWQ